MGLADACVCARARVRVCALPRRGSKLLHLPYAVKGMDVSFSGLLHFIEKEGKWVATRAGARGRG